MVSGFYTEENPCSECHQDRNYYEYCRFNPSSSSANLPNTIDNNLVFITLPIDILGSGSNHYYKIDDLSVSMESSNGFISIQKPNQQWNNLYPGGIIYFTTPISAIESGNDFITFTLTASNPHEDVTFSDTYSYEIIVEASGSEQQELAIEPSSWSLNLNNKKDSIQLFIKEDITDFIIDSSSDLNIKPNSFESLTKGQIIDISIDVLINEKFNENITINWKKNSVENNIQINIAFTPEIEEEINYYSILGRITGLISLIFLLFSIVLSGINKRIRRHVKKMISTKKRTTLHCYLSWMLFFISIFHGILLLLGPYNEFIWMNEIVLGYLTAISMFIVSINGSFMRFISKKIGPELWRKTHGYYSYLALLLCLIHAILIGTEFEFIRGLF